MADLSITAANVVDNDGSGIKTGTAGETITAGQAVYIDSTASNKLKLADADDIAKYECVGIALNSCSLDQPIDYVYRSSDFDPGAAVVIGTVYVLSGTAGGITADVPVSGDYTVILGVANATDSLRVDINGYNRADTVVT